MAKIQKMKQDTLFGRKKVSKNVPLTRGGTARESPLTICYLVTTAFRGARLPTFTM